MPMLDGHTLLTMFVVALGPAMYLRIVAKEKRRREKHLIVRLEKKLKELEAQEQADDDRIVEASPAVFPDPDVSQEAA